MKALVGFESDPALWASSDLYSFRSVIDSLSSKGVASFPGLEFREVLARVSKISDHRLRAVAQAFFESAPFSSKGLRAEADVTLGLELGAEELARFREYLNLIPESIDPGPRESNYINTLYRFAKFTETVEVIDSYVAGSLINEPDSLWLLERIAKDFTADITIYTRVPRAFGVTRVVEAKAELSNTFHSRFLRLLKKGQIIRIEMLQPSWALDMHDREITFEFERGAATLALGMGVKRFSTDPITGTDCFAVPAQAHRSRKIALAKMRSLSVQTFRGE